MYNLRLWISLTLAGSVIAATLDTAVAQAPPSGTGEVSLPPNASADWWATVQRDIRRSEYYVTWQEHTGLPEAPSAFQAPNRAHSLRTYFTADGIRVIPRTGRRTSWQWGLTLVGYGRAGRVRSPAAAELTSNDNRLE